jgi:DNA polymerase V
VTTAADFLQLSERQVRDQLTVVGVRLHAELRGLSCLPLTMIAPMRKGTAVTRSFGKPVRDRQAMRQAVSAFAYRAGEKLRAHGLVAGHMAVFMHTSPFRPGPQYNNQASAVLEATADSLALIEVATRLADRLWRDGYVYAKAGVMLTNLTPAAVRPRDLFPSRDPARSARLMAALDTVNARFGKGAIQAASSGITRAWGTRAGHVSPCYTTVLGDVLTART